MDKLSVKNFIKILFIIAGMGFLTWVWFLFFSVEDAANVYDIAMFIYFTFIGCLFAALPFMGRFISWLGGSKFGSFLKPKENNSDFHIQDIFTFIGELGIITYLFSALTHHFESEEGSEYKYYDGTLAVLGTLVMFLLAYYSLAKLMKRAEKSDSRLVNIVVLAVGLSTIWLHFGILKS